MNSNLLDSQQKNIPCVKNKVFTFSFNITGSKIEKICYKTKTVYLK